MVDQTEFYSTSGDKPEDHWFTGTLATIRAAGTGIGGKLSMVEFVHPVGYATPPHVHHNADETFYIIEGAVVGFCGDRTWRATAGASYGSHRASRTATRSRMNAPGSSPPPTLLAQS